MTGSTNHKSQIGSKENFLDFYFWPTASACVSKDAFTLAFHTKLISNN